LPTEFEFTLAFTLFLEGFDFVLIIQDVVSLISSSYLSNGQGFAFHIPQIHVNGQTASHKLYFLSAMMWLNAPSLTMRPSSFSLSAYLKKVFVVWSNLTPEYSTYMFLVYLYLLASYFMAPIYSHKRSTLSML
jgi:hypothetical protein